MFLWPVSTMKGSFNLGATWDSIPILLARIDAVYFLPSHKRKPIIPISQLIFIRVLSSSSIHLQFSINLLPIISSEDSLSRFIIKITELWCFNSIFLSAFNSWISGSWTSGRVLSSMYKARVQSLPQGKKKKVDFFFFEKYSSFSQLFNSEMEFTHGKEKLSERLKH